MRYRQIRDRSGRERAPRVATHSLGDGEKGPASADRRELVEPNEIRKLIDGRFPV